MDISYADKKLERILTNERLIKKQYTAFYKKLTNRMSELSVANSLEDISHFPPPNRHKLEGNYNNCWGINVSKNFRIILRPTGDWDELDLSTVQSVQILLVEDYH